MGCWYEGRPILPEMDPADAIQHGYIDRKGPGRLLNMIIPHRVLVIGLHPAWKIVRFADVTTFGGLGPVEFCRDKGYHPAEARKYIPIGGVPKHFDGLRAQAFPNVIHGYLRLDSICTCQYGIEEDEAELRVLPMASKLMEASPGKSAVYSTIESPSWVLDYYKDMSRAWADNVYGGKGYDGVEDLKADFSKIVAMYTPQAEAIERQAREAAKAAREKAAEASRLKRQKESEWRMSKTFWGASWTRTKWLSPPNPMRKKRRRRGRRSQKPKERPKILFPIKPKAPLVSPEVLEKIPTVIPPKVKKELKPEAVVVGKKLKRMLGAAKADPKHSPKRQDREKGQRDDDDDDDDDDDNCRPLFFGPIRDEEHVR